MHGALRAAGFSLMTMFVSCGAGASVDFTATPDERLYLPKPEVNNGQWKLPLLTPATPQQ